MRHDAESNLVCSSHKAQRADTMDRLRISQGHEGNGAFRMFSNEGLTRDNEKCRKRRTNKRSRKNDYLGHFKKSY